MTAKQGDKAHFLHRLPLSWQSRAYGGAAIGLFAHLHLPRAHAPAASPPSNPAPRGPNSFGPCRRDLGNNTFFSYSLQV